VLAKLDAEGQVLWAKRWSSDRAPQPAVRATPDGGAFFVQADGAHHLDRDGHITCATPRAPSDRVAFSRVVTDRDGGAILLGSLFGAMTIGGSPLKGYQTPVLVAIDASCHERWALALPRTHVGLAGLEAMPDEGAAVIGEVYEYPAPGQPFATRISGDGQVLWDQDLEQLGDDGFSFAGAPDGHIAVFENQKVLRFDTEGHEVWSIPISNTWASLGFDTSGNLVVARGTKQDTTSTMDFDLEVWDATGTALDRRPSFVSDANILGISAVSNGRVALFGDAPSGARIGDTTLANGPFGHVDSFVGVFDIQ
jgi:hypothetical protein